jgi:hypothetical protein
LRKRVLASANFFGAKTFPLSLLSFSLTVKVISFPVSSLLCFRDRFMTQIYEIFLLIKNALIFMFLENGINCSSLKARISYKDANSSR